MNNYKAIGFLLSQFKAMVLTFGQSEETLMMFIGQVEQMYNIRQISDGDKSTVYQVLHIIRGKRSKENINFDTYEIQNVLQSVDRILEVINKVADIQNANDVELQRCIAERFKTELKAHHITQEEFRLLLRIYNISKTQLNSTNK